MNKKLLLPFFFIGLPLGFITMAINRMLIKAGIKWFDGDSEGFKGIARFMGWCMVCSIPTIAAITYGIWWLVS
jgi:hypothetical protein|tara:strand:- start:543 stop:761 length:219 start_codon:yes stop_codon:yes gene_type:complete